MIKFPRLVHHIFVSDWPFFHDELFQLMPILGIIFLWAESMSLNHIFPKILAAVSLKTTCCVLMCFYIDTLLICDFDRNIDVSINE